MTAGGAFTRFSGCVCVVRAYSFWVDPLGRGRCTLVVPGGGGGERDDWHRNMIIAIVVVGVVPMLLVAAGVYVCVV